MDPFQDSPSMRPHPAQPWNAPMSSPAQRAAPAPQSRNAAGGDAWMQGMAQESPMMGYGLTYGRSLVQEKMRAYIPGVSGVWHSMKHLFHVNNSYVVNKTRLLLFPFTHRPTRMPIEDAAVFSAEGQPQAFDQRYAPPVQDINAPDLYIPVMSFVTFVLIVGLLEGTKMKFTPEVLKESMSTAMVTQLMEVLLLRLGMYLLNAQGIPLLELVAYTGYKYFGLCINMLVGIAFGKLAYYAIFLYTAPAAVLFMYRNMDCELRSAGVTDRNGPHRNYFVLCSALVQALLLWWLGM